jgi:hypothetical protein
MRKISYHPWHMKMPVIKVPRERRIEYPDNLRDEIRSLPVTFPYSRLILVTNRSRVAYQRAVQQLAFYFGRETGFGPAGYDPNDCGRHPASETRAFLLHQPDYEHVTAVGAGCFRRREYDNVAEPFWALQWVWLHPFERGQGRLTDLWPFFRAMFGPFHVEGPYSPAMRAFMTKHPPDVEWETTDAKGRVPLYSRFGVAS